MEGYYHFVGEEGQANTKEFVVSCYEYLFETSIFEGIRHLIIWSDGGGKHFKNTYMLHYWTKVDHERGIKVSLNFFESHHGHGIADASAAHVKNKVRNYHRDERKYFFVNFFVRLQVSTDL